MKERPFWAGIMATILGNGLQRSAQIRNELGLHARSASSIAMIAERAKAAIWIIKGDQTANAGNILDLLTLACPKGTMITIKIEDPEDLPILEEISALVDAGFGE